MVNTVSTSSAYSAVLASLMNQQTRESQIGQELSSGQVASDLKGYGDAAETLSNMQATNTQLSGYLTQTQVVSAKLAVQDQALQQIASAGSGARQAISNVIAAGDGATLMQSLQTYFQSAVSALNTTYDGQYLFSGGQVNTQPVTATNITDLTSAPSIASLFQNDSLTPSTQLDPTTNINTSFLANQVGTPLFTALQNIVAYVQANGPFSGTLTAAQTSFLESQLPAMDSVNSGLNDAAAENGVMQHQVDDAQTSLSSQQTMLQGLMGNITNADLAKASMDLQQAQLSLQASGEVLVVLKNSSLLSLLSPNGIG
jgi:flagellar hook-associated protein 3 FlgL